MSEGRPVSQSCVEMTHIVMPNDANPLGTIFGGRVMEWVDICGAIAAQRHCRTPVVLAGLDQMSFLHPIHVGEIAVLKSSVNYVSNTSLEVGVKVMSENPLTGARCHTSSAYLTYVSLDERGTRQRVVPLVLETDDDRRRWEEGRQRREHRLAVR
jgi:acyl-CoA hydrolase